MEYIRVMRKPDITLYQAFKVKKDTNINYKNDMVKQTIKDLKLHSVTTIKEKDYTSKYDTTIKLKEGDLIVFDGDERGYVKPAEELMTVNEVLEDLECIKEV